jgi:hypothetical protein
MNITAAHIVMPIVCIMVGLSLIYMGLFAGWGLVWAMGGGFFVTIGVGAVLLTLAWVLPGSLGALLRRPVVSIVIVGVVLAMMALTVYVGVAR